MGNAAASKSALTYATVFAQCTLDAVQGIACCARRVNLAVSDCGRRKRRPYENNHFTGPYGFSFE